MVSIPGKMTVSIIKKKISEYMTKHHLSQENNLLYNGANKRVYEGEPEDITHLDFQKSQLSCQGS